MNPTANGIQDGHRVTPRSHADGEPRGKAKGGSRSRGS
jgi:hypothetical protein